MNKKNFLEEVKTLLSNQAIDNKKKFERLQIFAAVIIGLLAINFILIAIDLF